MKLLSLSKKKEMKVLLSFAVKKNSTSFCFVFEYKNEHVTFYKFQVKKLFEHIFSFITNKLIKN